MSERETHALAVMACHAYPPPSLKVFFGRRDEDEATVRYQQEMDADFRLAGNELTGWGELTTDGADGQQHAGTDTGGGGEEEGN